VVYRKLNRYAEKRAGQKLNFLILFLIVFEFFEISLTHKAGESYVQLFIAKLL
jgi:hypothetical protein